MIEWRFDQGRLDYFRFDEIKKIAKGLYAINQRTKPRAGEVDFIRLSLSAETNLPFAPNNPYYPIWRNYGRVFKCLMLATEHNDLICTTDLCASLANNEINCDDYLLHFSKCFYYPSPAFMGYKRCDNRIYPIIAIIKTLISKYKETNVNYLSINEIAFKIASNNQITGVYPISFLKLIENDRNIRDDLLRQIRELVKFISQFSFLSWCNNCLYLDIFSLDDLVVLEQQFIPNIQAQELEPSLEILRLGKTNDVFQIINYPSLNSNNFLLFGEGNKVRRTHLITERNGNLRRLYFDTVTDAPVCKMCGLDTQQSYTWSEDVIEIHHLLPLASPVMLEDRMTSLKDLVGICPTCHRAVHKYYALWLDSHKQKDFTSYDEARHVYEEAKSKVKCIYR